jgi:hypothetical protein
MGNTMQKSTVFKELEAMAEKGLLAKSLTELHQLLKQLIKEGQITNTDCRALIEIYLGIPRKTH